MTRLIILTALAAAGLSGCASSGANTAGAELDRLRADCEAKGGILVPTGRTTGYEARDNVCKLQGPASRIEDSPRS